VWQTLDRFSKHVIDNDPFGDTHLIFYEDNVFEFSCKHFGITVRFDGELIEVISKSFLLMNKLCGLCGDFNGEAVDELNNNHESLYSNEEKAIHELSTENLDCHSSESGNEAICHKDTFFDVLERQLNITNILI
jgi:von Willebrand factor type D domain